MNYDLRRGSIWRKWDLHIHGANTILNNQYPKLADGGPDWDKYIERIEALELAVVGVTDYFTIESYKKILACKKSGRLSNVYTILPNIEFRLDKTIASRRDGGNPRRLNLHVIFSDEVDPKDIEEHFLHNIDFVAEGNPQNDDSREKLKISNLEALGKRLKQQNASFTGSSDLIVGATQAVVSHEQITEQLSNQRFKNKYLLVFPEELSNLISWDGQDHQTRKVLLQKSDMVFSANEKTVSWCVGEDPYREGVDKFVEEFKTRKPCIHGSDAHSILGIGHPCALRGDSSHNCETQRSDCVLKYCWIKADPTFEGLRQLLFEPVDRVRIQQEDPTPIRSGFTFSSISLSHATVNPELEIKPTNIPLNPGLVAIAGARGSGKTAFVDLIANCYVDRTSTDDKNSFVLRISEDKPDLDCALEYQDGKRFSKKVLDRTFVQDSQLVYIAQGSLDRYIDEKSDFEEYVRNLILDHPNVKNSVTTYEFEVLKTARGKLNDEIKQSNREIEKLEAKTTPENEVALAQKKTQATADLEDIVKRIAQVSAMLGPERLKEAEMKQAELQKLTIRKDYLALLQQSLEKAKSFVDNDIAQFNETIEGIRSLFTNVGISAILGDLQYPDIAKLNEQLLGVAAQRLGVANSLQTVQQGLTQLATEVQDHTRLLERKAAAEKKLEQCHVEEKALAADKARLVVVEGRRRELLRDIVINSLEEAKKYQELIGLFLSQHVNILKDLSFEAKPVFNTEAFLAAAEDLLDNRKAVVHPENGKASDFEALLDSVRDLAANDPLVAEKYADTVTVLTNTCKQKLKRSAAISIGSLYDFLCADYFRSIAVVKYRNTELRKLSMGQKATVLILIHLAQGDRPIIIDSHDEHLDNAFIMDELVKALRQAKEYRQIILVSNNGNVVINSDADQIVIPEGQKGVIWSEVGSIENKIIRERALKVLEGGEAAFRRRQEKYRLMR